MKVPAGNVDQIVDKALKEGIFAGVKLADDLLLIAATEMQTREDIDRYISLVNTL